jgi:hypothetical protein
MFVGQIESVRVKLNPNHQLAAVHSFESQVLQCAALNEVIKKQKWFDDKKNVPDVMTLCKLIIILTNLKDKCFCF